MFIVVGKLSDDPPYKWLSLVKDLCSKCSSVCYLLTVASHKDAVKKTDRMECEQQLQQNIEQFLSSPENLRNIGIVSLDCRKLDGDEFSEFKDRLSDACQSVRCSSSILENIDSQDLVYCNMLYRLLKSRNENVYMFDSLLAMIQGCSDYYLPETEEKLHETLHCLHRTGLILFINSSRGTWVVVKKECLLNEVNGKIFQLHQDVSSNTGELMK